MVCPKCGLPEELCACEVMAKEAQKITISVIPTRFNKYMTVVRGIDATKIDIKELLKKLKSRLACGGTWKNDTIELQGDHRERVKELLMKEGFPPDMIEVR
ncbi:MAG: translation initiation factor [Candidatus Aenigmatarchaeota archaeon]